MPLATFAPLVILVVASVANDSEAAKHHAESLARVKTIYLKIDTITQLPGMSEARKSATSQTWRSGERQRSISHDFLRIDSDGNVIWSDDPQGVVHASGFSDREVRTINNWDPEHPTDVDFAKHAATFGATKGTIAPRDPTMHTCFAWPALLFELFPGVSLQKMIESSEVTENPVTADGIVQFKVDKSTIPRMEGAEIDLDSNHGYMVCRFADANGSLAKVETFEEVDHGIWIPKRVYRTNGKLSTIIDVVECRVNMDIDDADLVLNFPKGGRVDDPAKGLMYFWGKDGPEKSFDNDLDFRDFLYEYARQSQSNGTARLLGAAGSVWRSSLFWGNVAFVVIIFCLFLLRRKVSAHGRPA